MTSRIAVLFPGQGAYLPGILADRIEHNPGALDVLEAIDAVAAEQGIEPVAPLLLSRDAPAIEELLAESTDRLDLAIYATNAVAFEVLTGLGVRADVLVGHSFGEFAALSASGAVTVADVARMACARTVAFHRAGPEEGGLLALDVPAWRAQHLVGILDDASLRLAIDNGPGQSVISGAVESLRNAEHVATGLGLRATRLRAAYAFHNPLLHGAADLFARATADLKLRDPRVPVFSPILGRYVVTAEDAREVIERNMIAPVAFYDGLLSLFREGITMFIEAGARQALTGIVRSSLPQSALAIPLLASRGDLDSTVSTLTDAGIAASRSRLTETPDAAGQGMSVPEPRRGPVAEPQPMPSESDERVNGTPVLSELTEMYASDLGFPTEMLTADIDLEADLGVDSVKQLALFQRVLHKYELPEPLGERRARATTLGEIAGLVEELRS
jgi:acyl transferase domain-containing protein